MIKTIRLNTNVQKLKEKSQSKNTRNKYKGDWLKFINYSMMQHKGLNPIKLIPNIKDKKDEIIEKTQSIYALTANYLAWLHENTKFKGKSNIIGRENLNNNPYSNSSYKASTIQRILASITYKFRKNGFDFNRKNTDISETINAIIRSEKNKNDGQAKEILKKDIIKIIDSIPISIKLRDIRDKAMILVGFYSFCRRSELLNMQYQDLFFSNSSIQINIPYSKTDQTGIGRVISIHETNDKYCPVKSLKEWLKTSKIKKGPLFYKINKSNILEDKTIYKKDLTYSGLTDTHFVLILKKRAHDAGIKDCEKISGHSLRIGAITQSRMNGVPIHEIMAQSGHKTTQMIDRYTKLTNSIEISAAKKI